MNGSSETQEQKAETAESQIRNGVADLGTQVQSSGRPHPACAAGRAEVSVTKAGAAVRVYSGPAAVVGDGPHAVMIAVSQEEHTKDGCTWFEPPTVGLFQRNEAVSVPLSDAGALVDKLSAIVREMTGGGGSVLEPREVDQRPPLWQTEPCPAWCRAAHSNSDHPEDREHHVFLGEVDQHLMPVLGDDGMRFLWSSAVYLNLNEGHSQPHITINTQNGGGDLDLEYTLVEAEQLRDLLTAALHEAKQ